MPRSPNARIPIGPTTPRVPNLMMRVWDAPTRLFHWTLVALIVTSYVAIKRDNLQLHFLSGYTILTLLLFRLVWGFVGSETARFRHFLRNPLEAFRHLAQFPRREPDTEIGHNAAGGWMVLVMLLLLLAQVGAGLFSNSDVEGEGPLAHHIARALSDKVTGIHGFLFNIVLAIVGMHVLAVVAYAVVKRHDLVRPMVTGRKRLPATMRQPEFSSAILALVILAGCAGLVWTLVKYG